MKIVIDIPEEIYQKIKETNMFISGRRSGKSIDYILFNAVINGTPLPKNHGRLIDANELSKGLIERWNTADNNAEKQISQVIANVVTPIVVSTPTIIPVESEEEV